MNGEGFSTGIDKLFFSVASYNIHRCIGSDGRRKPERIAGVIQELNPQLVGLQEVDSLDTCGSQTDYLARATGLTPIAGPTIRRGMGYYGNILLTAYPILKNHCLDISVKGWEPRSIIDATLDVHGFPVRVIVTHLGLLTLERRRQVKRLVEILGESKDHLILVLGDLNEWLPFSPRLRSLHKQMGKVPAPRTFPSVLPLLSLDRIWVRPSSALQSIRVHKSRLARVASDHLPVVADIAFSLVRGNAKTPEEESV